MPSYFRDSHVPSQSLSSAPAPDQTPADARRGPLARPRRPHRAMTMSLSLTPMIDITFNLLIFFLVATSFRPAEGVLRGKLPRAAEPARLQAVPISSVYVRIEQVGPNFDECQLLIENTGWHSGSFAKLADALAAVLQLPGYDEQVPVVIAASGNVAWDHVVNAYNAAVRAGFKNIGFGSR